MIDETGNQGESQEPYALDSKTEKQLMRTLVTRTLERALEPPQLSPMEVAINSVTSQIGAKVAENMLGNLAGGAPAKTGIIGDIMNSSFGANLGQTLGSSIPQIIDVLTKNLGAKKAGEIITSATQAMNQSPQEQSPQTEAILKLNINNPDDIKRYASAMNLSEQTARVILEAHQKDILARTQPQSMPPQQPPQTQPTQPTEPSQQEKIMAAMLEKMNNMEETIKKLEAEKIEKINATVNNATDRWNDDEAPMPAFNSGQKNVKLFNEPVKVDVDQIAGDQDPFFNEKPKEEKPKSPIQITKQPVKMVHQQDELSQDSEGIIKIVDDKEKVEPPAEPVVKEPEVQKIAVEEPKIETKPEETTEVKPPELRKKIHKVIRKKEDIKTDELK